MRGERSLKPSDQLRAHCPGREHLDVGTESHEIDDGSFRRCQAKRCFEPAVAIWRYSTANPEGLELAEHRSQPAALRGNTNRAPSGSRRPTLLATPCGRIGKGGFVAFQQLEAATGTTCGIDRDAGSGQLIEIAKDGPFGDFECSSEIGHRRATLSLQDQQE